MNRSDRLRGLIRRSVPTFIGIIVCCLFFITFILKGAGSFTVLDQDYDAPFHFSVVRHILDTGDISPLSAGTVMGGKNAYYPNLWHILVAILCKATGADMQTCAWLICILLLGIVAPLGCAMLVRRLFPNVSPLAETAAALSPVLLPYSALTYVVAGPLYSNLAGLSLLPGALALCLDALDTPHSTDNMLKKTGTVGGCIIVLALAHPNTDFALALILLLFGVSKLKTPKAKTLLVIAFFASWLAFVHSPLMARTINCLDRIEESARIGTKIFSLVGVNYDAISSNELIPASIILAISGISAIATRFTRRYWKSSWYIYALATFLALALIALFPLTLPATYFTGVWYRDYVRLAVLFVFLSIPALVGSIDSIARHRIGSQTHRNLIHAATIGCCALSLIASLTYYSTALSKDSSEEKNQANSAFLTTKQASFIKKIASITGTSTTMLNNYQDASVWLYPLTGIHAVVKGRAANQMTSMDDDTYTVITGIALYAEDTSQGKAVRDAVKRMGIQYVVQMSDQENLTTRFNSLKQIQYTPAGPNSIVTPNTPGFELVCEEAGCRLYKLQK